MFEKTKSKSAQARDADVVESIMAEDPTPDTPVYREDMYEVVSRYKKAVEEAEEKVTEAKRKLDLAIMAVNKLPWRPVPPPAT